MKRRSSRRIHLSLERLEPRLLLSLAVALQAASDTGVSSADNITSDNTPTYDVTVDAAGSIQIDWENDATIDIIGIVGGAGTYSFTPASTLPDASYPVAVTFGLDSATCPTTIDTAAPSTPGAPDLQAASDSGLSNTDDITNDDTPTFDLSALPYFRFYRDAGQISGNYESGAPYTAGAQPDGTYDYAVSALDVAGNESALSTALSVTIDTAAPTAPAAPDLQAASDSGISNTDDITNDNTPTFDVSASPYFRFYRDAGQISGNYESGASYTAGTQADGAYAYAVSAVDAAGNESALSTGLSVTIDTVAPSVPGAPDLQAASDTGDPTDNVTAIRTPTFDVTVPGGTYFRFYRDATLASEAPTLGDDGGIYKTGTSETLPEQPLCTFDYTATAVDVAGNESADSPALQVQITNLWPIESHLYADGVRVTIYDVDASDGVSSPSIAWYRSDFQRDVTEILINPAKIGDSVINSVELFGDGTNTADIGVVVEDNVGVKKVLDRRTGGPPLGLLVSEGYIKMIKQPAGLFGTDINGFTTEGGWTLSSDIDGDGDTADLTAVYSLGYVHKIRSGDAIVGDILIDGMDNRGNSLRWMTVSTGGFQGDLRTPGNVGKLTIRRFGNLVSNVDVGGSIRSIRITDGSILDSDIQVGGLLQKLQVEQNVRRTDILAGTLKSVKVRGQLGTGAGTLYSITDALGPVGDDDMWKLVVAGVREKVSGTRNYLDS